MREIQQQKPDKTAGRIRFPRGRWITGSVLVLAVIAGTALTGSVPDPKTTTTARPTAAAPPSLGTKEMTQLKFLSGNWEGKLESYAVRLDISINGEYETPANLMKFKIHAVPAMGVKIGIEGDYNSTVSYSARHRALRAVLTDENGRGVEMLGEKVADQPEWLFNSTGDGAPFPFKVRLRPVTSDTVVVNYSSGGRLPLRYEVTFNRVAS